MLVKIFTWMVLSFVLIKAQREARPEECMDTKPGYNQATCAVTCLHDIKWMNTVFCEEMNSKAVPEKPKDPNPPAEEKPEGNKTSTGDEKPSTGDEKPSTGDEKPVTEMPKGNQSLSTAAIFRSTALFAVLSGLLYIFY